MLQKVLWLYTLIGQQFLKQIKALMKIQGSGIIIAHSNSEEFRPLYNDRGH